MRQEPEFRIAGPTDLDALLPLVQAYHDFEQISMPAAVRIEALMPLLEADSCFGRIWLILSSGTVVGYVALCYGYSIEFAGRDAFIDEFYILEQARGQGIGSLTLAFLQRQAAALNIVALHLEVARHNQPARRLYSRAGFRARDRYNFLSREIDSTRGQ